MSTGCYFSNCHLAPCRGDDCHFLPRPHVHTSGTAVIFPIETTIIEERFDGVWAGTPDDYDNWVLVTRARLLTSVLAVDSCLANLFDF